MRPFQPQDYEAVALEEKQENDLDLPVQKSKRGKAVLAFLIFGAALTALLLVIGVSVLWTGLQQEIATSPVESPVSDIPKVFLEHEVRAPGDRYLLGVGKADITGYF